MANRRPQGSRRMGFGYNDRGPENFGLWQGGGPWAGPPDLLPLCGGSNDALLALASNIINLLQPTLNPIPSLLDLPFPGDFGPDTGRYDGPFDPYWMGNYNRAGKHIDTDRKPFKPHRPRRQPKKKTKNVKESEEEKPRGESDAGKQEEKENKEPSAPETRYDGIDPRLLQCHVCDKRMRGGRSFEEHLRGRAHAVRMQKTAESYALSADIMRQQFKIRDVKLARRADRADRAGRHAPRGFYCVMCDLFAADGAGHRATVAHRRLKRYLHPTCATCRQVLPTRIALDRHRLTPEHLRTVQDKSDVVVKPKPEAAGIALLEDEDEPMPEEPPRRPSPAAAPAPPAAVATRRHTVV